WTGRGRTDPAAGRVPFRRWGAPAAGTRTKRQRGVPGRRTGHADRRVQLRFPLSTGTAGLSRPLRALDSPAVVASHNAMRLSRQTANVLGGHDLNAAATRTDTIRSGGRIPLRDHVATSIRRYLRDLDGCD